MSKGDHVFNNVVSKLRGAFLAGLCALLTAKRERPGAGAHWMASKHQPSEPWLLVHMPRTSDALGHFTFHHELVTLREKLQTSTFVGGDVNNASYSSAAQHFAAATATYFERLAALYRADAANSLLPEVARVRRAFLQLTRAAEDPNARARLLAEHREQPARLVAIERELAAVDQSLDWAWARCEYLFRMTTVEALSLGR
jgi:hypothetical protein